MCLARSRESPPDTWSRQAGPLIAERPGRGGRKVANPLDDSSTNIDEVANLFCARLTQACGAIRQKIEAEVAANKQSFAAWDAANRVDNPNPLGLRSPTLPTALPFPTFRYGAPSPKISGATVQTMPRITFSVSPNRSSSFRTPAEQAREVVAGRSHVCWGAHMSDKARHILPRVDGRAITDGDEFERLLGPNLPWFQALWASELRSQGLLDAGGGTTWFKKSGLHDQLHVELPHAKIDQTDSRAQACVDEYARLLRVESKSQNHAFENALKPNLKITLRNSLAKYQSTR